MGRFSDEIRTRFPEHDNPAKIEERLADLETRLVPMVDGREVSPVASIPVKIVVILQVGMRRVLELGNAAIAEINGQHLTAMCVLVRAVFETCCLLYDLSKHLDKTVEADDTATLEEFDKYMVAALLGHKSKDWALTENVTARNVLTVIQRLNKELDGAGILWFYEGLSEHAHPNYHGMLASFSLVRANGEHKAITRFTERRPGRDHATTVLCLGSLATALLLLESAIERYEKNKDAFAALAERVIRDNGTWPEGREYPIRRGTHGTAPSAD